MKQRQFRDRREAGRQLAAALVLLKPSSPVILGLPRGGVPVAFEVARALQAPLDVLLVRKLGSPMSSELGIGALVEGDPPRRVLNAEMMRLLRPSSLYLAEEVIRQTKELQRRRSLYCGNRERVPLSGRTVIVVDDGIATGGSMHAALEAVRDAKPAKLVLAVPVAPADTLETLGMLADDTICLHTPEDFHAVSLFYDDFAQTEDEEVTALLDEAANWQGNMPYANESETNMKTVSEFMDHDATVVGPHDNLARAATIMKDWKVGVLPVCDGRRLIGMISNRDIDQELAGAAIRSRDGRSGKDIRVAEIMSDEVVWCFEDESIDSVMHRFGGSPAERIPVLNREMNLTGMLNIDRGMSDGSASRDEATAARMHLPARLHASKRFEG